MPPHDIEPTILRATGNSHPLNVTFIDEDDQKEPWKRSSSVTNKLVGPMPKSLTVTLANRLIRLAAFQNPEFYKKQAMRFSVRKEPRVSGCAEIDPLVENYGHVIVDECHHLSAESFEAILKQTKAKYVLGLTATPIHRDGRQPIIFMQCGPTRQINERLSSTHA